jgi:hypothetical protein
VVTWGNGARHAASAVLLAAAALVARTASGDDAPCRGCGRQPDGAYASPSAPRDGDGGRDGDGDGGRDGDGDGDGDDNRPEAAARPLALGTQSPTPPSVAAVIAAAHGAAGLRGDPARAWAARSRASGLVPWVSVRIGRDTRWEELDPDADRTSTLELRATWRLDRLLADPRELQVASVAAARRREQQQLATRVIRAYFEWKRWVASAPGGLRAEEAAAELDAMTDGWFSAEISRRAVARAPRGRAAP